MNRYLLLFLNHWKPIAGFLTVIAGLIGSLGSGILVPYLWAPASFDVSYSSIGEPTMHGYIHNGCEKQLDINVESFRDYNLPVSLSAVVEPPLLDIVFVPESNIPKPKFTSIAVIKSKPNVPDGNYRLFFVGNGLDGSKKIAGDYTLTIYKSKIISIKTGVMPTEICGDNESISIENCRSGFNSSVNCTKLIFKSSPLDKNGWAGFNLDCLTLDGNVTVRKCFSPEIRFFAKGENGGETLEVRIGGLSSKTISHPNLYHDSTLIKLKKERTEYKFPVHDKELDYLINKNYSGLLVGGLGVVINRKDNMYGCTAYLDDIEYDL